MLGILGVLIPTGIEMVVSSEGKYISCASTRVGPQVEWQYLAS